MFLPVELPEVMWRLDERQKSVLLLDRLLLGLHLGVTAVA